MAEGARDPWRSSRHGPTRAIILTADAAWFEVQDGDPFSDDCETREAQFQRLSVAWLKETFGDNCIHARADRDEKTYHIHAVIFPWTTTKDGRDMLLPSIHPSIRSYEKAQDDVGAWFAAADIGLTRGERRKQKLRDALERNRIVREARAAGAPGTETKAPLPKHRAHVSPRQSTQDTAYGNPPVRSDPIKTGKINKKRRLQQNKTLRPRSLMSRPTNLGAERSRQLPSAF